MTVRRCHRCGILASDAALQGEPVCNENGLVSGHSYRDYTLIEGAATDAALTAGRDGQEGSTRPA